MKIEELDQRCGECEIIDLCGEPFSEVCLCTALNKTKILTRKDENIRNY